MEALENVSFQIISYAGSAKAKCHEALQAVKAGDFEKAELLLKEGQELFIEAHKVHTQLIQKEANNEAVTPTLLLIHAEDQLMNAEISREYLLEIIALQKEVAQLKKEK